MRETYDRLNPSRYGLLIISLISLLALVTLTVFPSKAHLQSLEMTQDLIKGMGLSTPALFPSGRASRDAAYLNPAIDLRHSPHQPLIVFSPDDLIRGGFKKDP
jgi:hypothetical protein